MDDKTKYILIAVLVLGLLSSTVAINSLSPVIYEGGWEVKHSINKVRERTTTYTQANPPLHNYSWGGSYVKFDVDGEARGTPTIEIRTTGLTEYVSVDGEWVEAREDEVFKKIPKKVDDDVYFFYHHVFFTELSIIAEGEQESDPLTGVPNGECDGQNTAREAIIGVYLLVDADLWSVLDTITSDNGTAVYQKADVWTGVMSASVVSASGDYVEPLPEGFSGFYGGWSVTNVDRLNMFYTGGGAASDTSLDDLQADPSIINGVPNAVEVEVAGTELQPAWWKPPGGASGRYAVEARYRLRIDIVTSALYTFQQGDQDDSLNNADIDDRESQGIFGELGAFFSSLGGGFTNLIYAIVIVIVVYYFAKLLLSRRGQ